MVNVYSAGDANSLTIKMSRVVEFRIPTPYNPTKRFEGPGCGVPHASGLSSIAVTGNPEMIPFGSPSSSAGYRRAPAEFPVNLEKRCPRGTIFRLSEFVHAMVKNEATDYPAAANFDVLGRICLPGHASRTLRQISRELDGDLTTGREEFRRVFHREEELCD